MSKPSSNPFFETDFTKLMDVSKFMDMSKFADASKAFSDFKLASPNFEALMSAQRRNIEAFTALNQAAFESVQGLIRRQTELVREGMQEAASTVNAVLSSPSPEEKVIRQAEASKAAVDKCIANARDITETLTKCNYQALEAVSSRLNESLEELRGMIKQASSKAA